jgi:hypothetical protein
MDNQEPLPRHPRSHLFTVRLWMEALGHGQVEVRMQVKHVLSGETRYFREWPQVVAFITDRLEEDEGEPPAQGDHQC